MFPLAVRVTDLIADLPVGWSLVGWGGDKIVLSPSSRALGLKPIDPAPNLSRKCVVLDDAPGNLGNTERAVASTVRTALHRAEDGLHTVSARRVRLAG